MSPANGGWTFNVLYALQIRGGSPVTGVALDGAGNLWGTGDGGLYGTIWELAPSTSGWNLQIVYQLDQYTGGAPLGLFTFDQAGNMYGTLSGSGPKGNGGVFQYVPSTSQISLLYAAPGNPEANYGPQGGVAMDQAGNLYAADPYNGAYDYGYVFRLTPSNGNWTYTDLHDFTGSSDGGYPYGPLVVDAQGNVYGAAGNVIFEITP